MNNKNDKKYDSGKGNFIKINKNFTKNIINTDLENIKEIEEDTQTNLSPIKEIKTLNQKIFPLESKISSLKKEFNEINKENKRNNIVTKRNTFFGQGMDNKSEFFKMTKLIKEKIDLQEINEKLNNNLKLKENEILEFKNKMNNLEFEFTKLKNLNDKEKNEENKKLKEENTNLIEKMKNLEKSTEQKLKDKEKEINEKIEEINNLKAEKNKNEKDIIELKQKIDLNNKEKGELCSNIISIRKQLELKEKEIEEINSINQQVIQNKEDLINKYKKEIETKFKYINFKKLQIKNGDNKISNDDFLINLLNLNNFLNSNKNNSLDKNKKRNLSFTIERRKPIDIINFLNNSKVCEPKGKEIKNEKKEKIEEETENLKEEITKLKIKYLNMQFENETKIAKYKNTIKNIEKQCKKVGVKIDFIIDNI